MDTSAVPTRVLIGMPLNSMVRLSDEIFAGLLPGVGVKVKLPFVPPETVHWLDDIDALDSGGAVIQRFVASGVLPSTGREILICPTVTEPTDLGQEMTKISVA
jgi:hypothetical protein